MKLPSKSLCCPIHRVPLETPIRSQTTDDGVFLICSQGCRFPQVGGIPRFLEGGNYASSFGLQWKRYRLTQLDSHTGLTLSHDRLRRCLGGSFEAVKGKDVLEAGCGAGRFTEVLLKEGARVVATDLSSAVEASYANFQGRPDYFVCQADILCLPFAPEQFDVVLCLGVVQHTPSPEKTIEALCSHIKPGGWLVLDHYTTGHHVKRTLRFFRAVMIRIPPFLALILCRMIVAVLWPLHRLVRIRPRLRGMSRLSRLLTHISPVADYHAYYTEMTPVHLRAWAMLDTHDTLTDRYKHTRTAEEIAACLRACGMIEIHTVYAGNGVEARARKPAIPAPEKC